MRYEAWDAKLNFEAIRRLDDPKGPQAVILHADDHILVVTKDEVAAERIQKIGWSKIDEGFTPSRIPTQVFMPNCDHRVVLLVLEDIPPVLSPPLRLSSIWAKDLQLVTS